MLTPLPRRRIAPRKRGPELRPLVEVESSYVMTGRGSFCGPDTDRRTSWWVLTLACGHEVERDTKYKPNGKSYNRHRSIDDVLPAPKRARCDACLREANRA